MTCEAIQIVPASPDDSSEILALLASVNLPHEGVDQNLPNFLVARNKESKLVGVIGLERHGNTGLLRSAAVAPECQRSGLGSRLTQAILASGMKDGIEKVVLMTTTARDFFESHFGFCECSRSDYDEQLASSEEWRLPRCASAVCMSLDLVALNCEKVTQS